jgi:hypothetical protein
MKIIRLETQKERFDKKKSILKWDDFLKFSLNIKFK